MRRALLALALISGVAVATAAWLCRPRNDWIHTTGHRPRIADNVAFRLKESKGGQA